MQIKFQLLMEQFKEYLPWVLAMGSAIGWLWTRITSKKHAAVLLEQANVKLLQDIIASLREENTILKADKEAEAAINKKLAEVNQNNADEIRKMRIEIQELKTALIRAKIITGTEIN